MILVTGATGFIGQRVVNHLGGIGYRILSRTACEDEERSDIHYGDLSELLDYDILLDGVDVVLHLAGLSHNKANDDDELISVNTDSTLQLAKEAGKRGIKRFVFASSILVYDERIERINLQSNLKPRNSFALSKLNAENGLRKIAKDFDFELVILRLPLVYGSDAPGNFGLLTKIVKSLPFLPFGLVDNKRSIISVDNAASIFVHSCLIPEVTSGVFLVSDGCDVSTRELTNKIAIATGKKIFQIPIPVLFLRFLGSCIGKGYSVEQLVGNLTIETETTFEKLSWRPFESIDNAMNRLNHNI